MHTAAAKSDIRRPAVNHCSHPVRQHGPCSVMEQLGFMCFAARYSSPHPRIPCITGIKLLPSSVSEYSTRGGTTGYTFLIIKPSRSSSLSCFVSILGVADEIIFCNLPKRRVPSARCHKISVLYFPPISSRAVSTGHIYVRFIKSSPLILSFLILPIKKVHTCKINIL